MERPDFSSYVYWYSVHSCNFLQIVINTVINCQQQAFCKYYKSSELRSSELAGNHFASDAVSHTS